VLDSVCGIFQLSVGTDLNHPGIGNRTGFAGGTGSRLDPIKGETLRPNHHLDWDGAVSRDSRLVGKFRHAPASELEFPRLLVIVLQAICVYMIAALVLPDAKADAEVDLREHYFAHRHWFFGPSSGASPLAYLRNWLFTAAFLIRSICAFNSLSVLSR
jgi:hypothetical protein